ncbi:MAG: winged helix-turn-helix domain-containing protein [Colwellia sp.]|nr:winged helix-turn-helix domain-containing protein [Colwellia sp.]
MIYKYVDLTIDSLEFQVTRNSEIIKLPKLSFELFLYFLNNSEQICSIDNLAENVWRTTQVSDETIVQRITLLRKALNDNSKHPIYIASIRGRGYRLIQPVYQQDKKQPKSKPILLYSAALCILCVGLVFFIWLVNAPEQALTRNSVENHKIELLDRAKYYQKIGQQDDLTRAVTLYRQLLAQQPDNIKVLIGLSNSLNKLVCRYNFDRKHAIQAQKLAEHAIILQNKDAGSWQALGFSWDCQGNLEKALSAYLKAVELAPADANSRLGAAHLFTTKGKWLKSLQLIQQSKALNHNAEVIELQLAKIYELSGLFHQAEVLYKKLFQLYPDNVFINEAYPRFLYIQGNLSEAKKAFNIAFARKTNSAYLYSYYAELTWLLEGREHSLPWFTKASKINPNKSYPKTIEAILTKSITIAQAKEKITLLNESIQWGDTWPITFVEKALLQLAVLKQPHSSITTLRQAVESGYMESEYLLISPIFNPLKETPDFFQLIDQINQQRAQLKQILKQKLIHAKMLPSVEVTLK